jgi:hypothetical protein
LRVRQAIGTLMAKHLKLLSEGLWMKLDRGSSARFKAAYPSESIAGSFGGVVWRITSLTMRPHAWE